MYEIGTITLYGTALTNVFDRHFIDSGPKTISVMNYGVTTVFPCQIQWSADKVAWGTLDGTSVGSLGSGAQGYSYIPGGYSYLRLMAACGTAAGTCLLTWNINRQ